MAGDPDAHRLESGDLLLGGSLSPLDDGPGMPAEQRNDVRPFRSTKAQGLGLGLPIAIKLVQLHDGRVVLSSRTGGGTTCVVYLPGDKGEGV